MARNAGYSGGQSWSLLRRSSKITWQVIFHVAAPLPSAFLRPFALGKMPLFTVALCYIHNDLHTAAKSKEVPYIRKNVHNPAIY